MAEEERILAVTYTNSFIPLVGYLANQAQGTALPTQRGPMEINILEG